MSAHELCPSPTPAASGAPRARSKLLQQTHPLPIEAPLGMGGTDARLANPTQDLRVTHDLAEW